MNKAAFALLVAAALGSAGCTGEGARDGPPVKEPPPDQPSTVVPAELVGTWEHGTIDFALWENYKEGHYAGRNALPMREAMVIRKNGDAKYYRYEQLHPFYESLTDCEGTVTVEGDTFTFRPTKGRKRYYDTRNAVNNKDRALTDAELGDPKLAGKRKYAAVADSDPPALRITVPTSAPYNWYKKQ